MGCAIGCGTFDTGLLNHVQNQSHLNTEDEIFMLYNNIIIMPNSNN